MSRKEVFSKNLIFIKAFEIFLNEGMNKITVRNIAKSLGCSTTPIYKYYSSVDELKRELIEHLILEIKKYTEYFYTDDEILNKSIGVCRFVKEKKKIFLSIYKDRDFLKNFLSMFTEKNMSIEKRNWWIFVYGYSVLIGNSCVSSDLEKIRKNLESAKTLFQNKGL